MTNFEISDSAKADIRDISSYTRKRYGREQVRKYMDMIYNHIFLLAENPYLGHARPDIVLSGEGEEKPLKISFPYRVFGAACGQRPYCHLNHILAATAVLCFHLAGVKLCFFSSTRSNYG
ncbi:MAG: type II toxin-antitoxin system RelE/ParE family toxin [Xenococcaceae cyanobacterium]